MKKNAFTLVELLAVIAILAILVIISLPNVMGMFNQAKKNSFVSEIKEIYKASGEAWRMDSLINSSEQVYSRCSTCKSKSLDLSGRTNLDYYIRLDRGGEVMEFYATDGTYQYSQNDQLDVTDIKDVKTISELRQNEVFTIENDEIKGLINKPILTLCKRGQYYDASSESCYECPINTYKDMAGNFSCTSCPVGTCTQSGVTGATSASQCSEACTELVEPRDPVNQSEY